MSVERDAQLLGVLDSTAEFLYAQGCGEAYAAVGEARRRIAGSSDVPSAASIMRAAVAQLEALERFDFETLSRTVLGEACTRAEIEAVADQPHLVDELVEGMRASADLMEGRA